ncbi:MAG: VOC family protein [Aeromicrobium sp.]|nr:VOC family protein [Burkholderiales bacterium]
MLLGLRTVAYHVNDLDKARRWFTELVGHAPYFDEPYYVGFNVGGYELGLLPDVDGVGTYWGVDDIEAEVARLVGLGATIKGPISDVGGDIKTATVIDPFGNEIGVIENPNFKLA